MNGILTRVHAVMPDLLLAATFTFAALAFRAFFLGAAAFTFAALAFRAFFLGTAAFTFAALAFRAALGTAAFTFAALAFLGVFFSAAAFTFAAFAFFHVGIRDLHVATVQIRHGKRIATVRRCAGNIAGSQAGSESSADGKGKRGFGFVSHLDYLLLWLKNSLDRTGIQAGY